ncbi:MAG: imidazole glycerol phosphate synthase subunit HisH [Alphaproteobacteria bacterium]|nr:imidazole glycerol phosphate synthase subunit HisH [Alphaproteobacteria bacterium]
MIVIVDYGMGNVGAIVNMLDFLGLNSQVSSEAYDLEQATHLILPGVGAFDRAMTSLRDLDLVTPLEMAVFDRGTPILGICLGMQLLGRSSQEGSGEPGLGWIPADTIRLDGAAEQGLKVPHVGWNSVYSAKENPLFLNSCVKKRYYFVHSYHMRCEHGADIAATCEYGETICCAVSHGHIHGVQFHPEKSHRHGMALLSSFAQLS